MDKTDSLPKQYQKALSLLEAGNHTYREIAKLCKINEQNFYDLIEGTYDRSKTTQDKFTEALQEIHKRRDKEIRDLVKSNKKATHLLINSWLIDQKKLKKVNNQLMPTVVSVANALSKSTPNVEIGSFSYTRGLSPEDIYAEFQRLSGLASDRGTIQAPAAGRTGEIPVSPGSRGAVTEESEDITL
jgi:hypothetical protein